MLNYTNVDLDLEVEGDVSSSIINGTHQVNSKHCVEGHQAKIGNGALGKGESKMYLGVGDCITFVCKQYVIPKSPNMGNSS